PRYLMNEHVARLGLKTIRLPRPAADRNPVSDFPDLIALARNRQDVEAALQRELQHRTRHRGPLRMLVEPAVRGSQHGAAAGRHRDAESRARSVLGQRARESLEPQAAVD